jgi:hypothetical protein
VKDSFYKEQECVFNQFPEYHMKILLGDFNEKVGREDISDSKTGNERLHEISNNNGVTEVNFTSSKNLIHKSVMFVHCNIHKYTWTSPDWKMNNQIDYVMKDKRWHSSTRDIDHNLVVVIVGERISVSK